jgi:hypothetical protein
VNFHLPVLVIAEPVPRAAIIVLVITCDLLLNFNFNMIYIPKIVLQLPHQTIAIFS